MPTCKYCGTNQLEWRSITDKLFSGIKIRWELWDNIPNKTQRPHDCGHREEAACRYCGEIVKIKVEEGGRFKRHQSIDISTGEDHRCKWENIKHLKPWEFPYNWRIKVKYIR